MTKPTRRERDRRLIAEAGPYRIGPAKAGVWPRPDLTNDEWAVVVPAIHRELNRIAKEGKGRK